MNTFLSVFVKAGKGCLLFVLCVFILTGCSSIINSHEQKKGMMSSYAKGDNKAVMSKIDGKLKEPHWYNSSTVNTGDELMWRLEAGSANFHLGNYEKSIDQFKHAEELIAGYDDRATVSVRNVGAEGGAAVTNLNALPYRGFCRDRIALSFYKALAYLGAGNEDAFRAQVRRLRDEQKKVQEDYQKYFEEEQAELEESKVKNPKAAAKFAEAGSQDDMVGSADNKEFASELEKAREIANNGYGNFMNPAAIFLSGLGSIRDENYDNARIDFERLCEAMPKNQMLRKYYATVLQKADREIPESLSNVKPFSFPLDRDCVYVVFANGRSAAFRAITIYFPVMTAWPVCEFYDEPFTTLEAEAGGKKYKSMILADMDGIIAQEYNERLPGMITRIVLNTLIKEAAYYGSLTAIAATNMDPKVKAIALAGTAVGGAAYRIAMNTADTRSWEILPKEFQLTQFPMPKDKTVKLTMDRNGLPVSKTLALPEDCKSAIIFVDAPTEKNISYLVLPLTSK